jgi:hypothetical protein
MLLQRDFIAAGPAGDDQLVEILHATLRFALGAGMS